MKYQILFRAFLYALAGLIILFMGDNSLAYLHIIVGATMIASSSEEIAIKAWIKSYKTRNDTMYTPLTIFILGIIIFVMGKSHFDMVCIIWGVVSIIDALKEINHEIAKKFKYKYIITWTIELIIVGLSVVMIIDPIEHVSLHLVILGIELIVEGINIALKLITHTPHQIYAEKVGIHE